MKVDEFNHSDRIVNGEIRRQNALKENLGCKFIQINPDEHNFNMFKATNRIYRHVKKSSEKSF